LLSRSERWAVKIDKYQNLIWPNPKALQATCLTGLVHATGLVNEIKKKKIYIYIYRLWPVLRPHSKICMRIMTRVQVYTEHNHRPASALGHMSVMAFYFCSSSYHRLVPVSCEPRSVTKPSKAPFTVSLVCTRTTYKQSCASHVVAIPVL
jgi:hypothetical protein